MQIRPSRHTDTCYIMSKSQVKMLVHVMGINESGIRAHRVEFSEKGGSSTIYTQYRVSTLQVVLGDVAHDRQ